MPNADPSPAPPLPNGWLSTILGLAAALVVLAGGAVLTIGYVSSRPLDLDNATLNIADAIQTGLVSNRVPERNIQTGVEARESDRAVYNFVTYEVTVPSMLDPGRLQSVLRRQLQKMGVSVLAGQGSRGEPLLGLTLADQPFGYVRLTPQPDKGWNSWPSVDEGKATAPQVEKAPTETEMPPDDSLGQPADASPAAADDDHANEAESALHSEDPSTPTQGTMPETAPVGADTPDPTDDVASKPEEPVATVESRWTPPDRVALMPEEKSEKPAPRSLMRVAIILDDGGYGGETTERVLALDPGLTLSILPYTPHAKETAERAEALGFEVMLHMPMENLEHEVEHEGQLEVGMSPATINALTLRALDQVPGAVGINNHMGSKFTADELYTGFFIDAIKDKNLYFIDSRTTAESCAYDLAVKAGLRAGFRNIFLDHVNDPAVIEKQFDMMMEMANEKGSAIAIGHFRPGTLDILELKLPALEAAGIKLVHVSDVLP